MRSIVEFRNELGRAVDCPDFVEDPKCKT